MPVRGVIRATRKADLSPKSIRTYIGTLAAIFNAEVEVDLLQRTPVRGFHLETVRRRERPTITDEQLFELGAPGARVDQQGIGLIVAPAGDGVVGSRRRARSAPTVTAMSNPRNWQPPENEGWEQAADSTKHRRWTHQGSTLIKWGWVAMFVLVGIAILVGSL